MSKGGAIILIPGRQGNILSYNQLISTQSSDYLQPKRLLGKKVTEIEFKKDIDHESAKLGLDINFIYISVIKFSLHL